MPTDSAIIVGYPPVSMMKINLYFRFKRHTIATALTCLLVCRTSSLPKIITKFSSTLPSYMSPREMSKVLLMCILTVFTGKSIMILSLLLPR